MEKELTIDRGELKMILSYGIGQSEVERILEKYDYDGNKGTLICRLINKICACKHTSIDGCVYGCVRGRDVVVGVGVVTGKELERD